MVGLSLYAFGANIPHPSKAHRGGEDSFFISLPGLSAIGVADGVGGWANQGINPKAFADDLMTFTYEAIAGGEKNPMKALDEGYGKVEQVGSCTAVVGIMDASGSFHAANIGDSGFMIIREGKVIFRTEEQQHGFNFPYQLGKVEGKGGQYLPHGGDRPSDSDVYQIALKENDIIIMGSDGLFDNLWDDDTLRCVVENEEDGPKIVASILAEYAHAEAKRDDIWTPFAQRAFEAGDRNITMDNIDTWLGGKMDDITVVVGYVFPAVEHRGAENQR